MELQEEVDIKKPIKHLCWSPSCSRMAISTEDGSISAVNPLDMSGSLVTISDHHHTRLTGIDVLCPGSEYCVVSKNVMEIANRNETVRLIQNAK